MKIDADTAEMLDCVFSLVHRFCTDGNDMIVTDCTSTVEEAITLLENHGLVIEVHKPKDWQSMVMSLCFPKGFKHPGQYLDWDARNKMMEEAGIENI
jgi:hypothetical protein